VRQLTPEQQFNRLLGTDPTRPFVTYYDESTGERSELSVKSLANWVAKTHHLLGDELGLGVGDTALVAVPPHWISVPVLLGCLTAGLSVVGAGDADVAFVEPATAGLVGTIPDAYAIAPSSAAVGLRGAEPDGCNDYVVSVRPQADAWATVHLPASGSDAGLGVLSRSEVVDRAATRASKLGLQPGGRLLTTRDWTSADDWIDAVFAPLAVAGSVVIVRNCADAAVLDRRAAQERVTVRL
jgi:uncharacterized protein (TIGR03089 family)